MSENEGRWTVLDGLRARLRIERVASTFTDSLSGRRVWYWHDPETGKIYLATRRFGLTFLERPGRDLDQLLDRLRKLERDGAISVYWADKYDPHREKWISDGRGPGFPYN